MTFAQDAEQHQPDRHAFLKGWEPRVTLGDTDGEAISAPTTDEQDEDSLIIGWRLDPEEWRIIDGTLLVNRWQMKKAGQDEGLWLYQYKARLARRRWPKVDLDDLLAAAAKVKPAKVLPRGPRSLVVCLSDWQLGKADGDGVAGTIERIRRQVVSVRERIKREKPDRLVVVGMGDLVESCDGNYPSQRFTVELNRRQQCRLARSLIMECLTAWVPLCEQVTVSAVPGNHGENRQGGKAFTTIGDNDDVACFEAVKEACDQNPAAFGHVDWVIPEDDHGVTLTLHGWECGFTHGHIPKAGATPQQKQEKWWADQAFGKTEFGEVDYLFTAHYHHYSVVDLGPRVHFQCPANDGGSDWWVRYKGRRSKPGTLTVMVGEDGWDDAKVLT